MTRRESASRHESDLKTPRRQLEGFPGHQTLVARVRSFRQVIERLRYGAAKRFIKRHNALSKERAKRLGTDIVTVNRRRPDGHVDSRTTVPLDAEAERVLAALFEVPWSTWWRHSDTEVLERDAKQRIRRFVIHPLGKRRFPQLYVEIALDEPRSARLESGEGIVIAADFSGSFNGRGRLEIEDLGSDRSRLGIHWPDFAVAGPLGPLPGLAIVLHGNTLEGKPFVVLGNESYLSGTGFDGLQSYLKAQARG